MRKLSVESLRTKGFVGVSYPSDLRMAVADSVNAWKRFCDLPENIKAGLPYSNKSDGVGYEMKKGEGPKSDRKENFDLTLAAQETLEHKASKVRNPTALAFVRSAAHLVGLVKPTILKFAARCEEEFGMTGFAEEIARSEKSFFIRFIHYFGGQDPGSEIGSAHVDQSGFTLHLFESAPGLQCYGCDHEMAGLGWIDMPVTAGKTVIIPAMQMQLRSNGELTALCHRVLATPQTAQYGRYSAVCFVQFKDTPKYDKDRWGRLQEKRPGFNYTIPIAKFRKLFKA